MMNFPCSGPLRIDELVDRVYKDFKERFVVGEEVTGVRDEVPSLCRVLKVLGQAEDENPLYEVAWLHDEGKKVHTSRVSGDNLRRRKHPFSRVLLKAFIRESASSGPSRSSAWFVHDKLARKYKIPIEAPERPKVTEKESKRASLGERGKRSEVWILTIFAFCQTLLLSSLACFVNVASPI
jgi:hypothetical protein